MIYEPDEGMRNAAKAIAPAARFANSVEELLSNKVGLPLDSQP